MEDPYLFSSFPPETECQQTGLIRPLKYKRSNDSFFQNDAAFDWLYPEHLQLISLKHWTPLSAARAAAAYLAVRGCRILDIGSGTGEFCLTAAQHYPHCDYYGVEQRMELVHYAERARDYLGLTNASFLHANVTQVNFGDFNHFYFYNPFHENVDQENAVDDSIEVSRGLYEYYANYICNALKHRPAGTRVVTYQTDNDIIPSDYRLAAMSFNQMLKLWISE